MAERYKIYELLGAGGVGAVFRAYDNELKRWVAIKRLMTATEATGDNKLASELRREADALASLRNPNIVTIYDVASDAEGLFIVMELLEGDDLATLMSHGPLHYDDFKELASQTLEALLAAHQRHILHRDIKPENIKVERLPGGRLQSKIIDFGLARAGMRARKQTEDQEGTVMGSIFYMAPEQLTREPVDVRTDMYSLGCVFYEALSGRKAFDGESMGAVIDKHINHDIVPLNVVAPHVPPWLGAWVLRLMAQRPEERPLNAQQAIEEFRAWEKMAAAPPMMPWMPPGYATQHGSQPIYMPGASTTQVMPGGITTNGVPVQPMYYQTGQVPMAYAEQVLEVVQEAQPFVEIAAQTAPVARAPSPRNGARTGAVPGTRSVGSRPITTAPQASKVKLYALIGGGVVVVAGIAFFLLSKGTKGESESKSTVASILMPSLAEVKLELPADRAFPPIDDDICMHYIAGVGGTDPLGKNSGLDALVVEWHDLAPLGKNNILRAYKKNISHAPRLVAWPEAKEIGFGVKANRRVLDFTPRQSGPLALVLDDPGSEAAAFPFSTKPTRGEKGLTVGLIFQLDSLRLPTRIFTLSAKNGGQVFFRIDPDQRFYAVFEGAGARRSLTLENFDISQPCTALMTWNAATGAVMLRIRDATGKFEVTSNNANIPTEPLTRLEIGRVAGDSDPDAPKAEQFNGKLGQFVVYSSVLKNDQLQQLEARVLRDYYLQSPPAKKKSNP